MMFEGKIKVILPGGMAFPVDTKTLEPTSCCVYSPYDPYPQINTGEIETIGMDEYERRLKENNRRRECAHCNGSLMVSPNMECWCAYK